jgi:hypothetical protein
VEEKCLSAINSAEHAARALLGSLYIVSPPPAALPPETTGGAIGQRIEVADRLGIVPDSQEENADVQLPW